MCKAKDLAEKGLTPNHPAFSTALALVMNSDSDDVDIEIYSKASPFPTIQRT